METSLKIRLDKELKESFTQATEAQGHTVAAGLRGFMRAYIEASEKMAGKSFTVRIAAMEVVE